LSLDDGSELYGDAVVLAVGNPPPTQLPVADALHGHPAYVEDPWTMPAPTGAGERVFLIGTGLTMIDVVLATASRASGGVFHALSRHGLVGYRQTSFRPNAFRGSGEAVMFAALRRTCGNACPSPTAPDSCVTSDRTGTCIATASPKPR
jgi:uncharacterized NAD(P)/FAD-binding protein YdhS